MAARGSATKVSATETEERLLIEAAQQDPRNFGDLYEIHFERVYAFIARRVHRRDTAEDLTSDVFQKALGNLQNYQWRGAPFAAWLIRIAANVVADQLKRSARELPGPENAAESSIEPDQETDEQRARLFRLVDRLPAGQRRVIFQRFVEQKSIREIARQLGKTEGAVKQLQLRALQNLRMQMEGADA
jgi:RNA polymerase sigma-70 factor (ECF subfamily)